MEPKLVTTIVCPVCSAELPLAARVCSHCGAAAAAPRCRIPPAASNRDAPSLPEVESGRSLLDRPWFILGLLFLVTAILGLPLLWVSRGFSRAWKIVLSVVVTLYTALLLWGFWQVMNWSVSRIMDSLR